MPCNKTSFFILQVLNTASEFKVSLDVSHFKPSELSVKTTDTMVTIHGHHEEREDEHGMIMREFKRSYKLPKVSWIIGVLCPPCELFAYEVK